MRDHRQVLGAIDPAVRRGLQARSDWAGLRHLAVYASALALCSGWIMLGLWGWPVAVLVQGVLLAFLFTLEHECTHDTPFASKRLCTVVGHFCGAALILPLTWFRYFHLAHHKYTNDPRRDPELRSGAKPQGRAAFVWHVSGLPYWGGAVRGLWTCACGCPRADYLPERALGRVRREARVMLAVYMALALSLFWTSAALWLWVIPALLGQPVLRLYLLAEHGRCPPVANMLENTRTTLTNRLVRFVAWNMPYHIEHHSAPNVPFHKLPELHDLMRADLISTSPGYRAFTKDYVSELT